MRNILIIMILMSVQVSAIGFAPAGVLGTIDEKASIILIAYRANQTLFESEPAVSIDGQFYNQVTIEDDGKMFDMLVVISYDQGTLNITEEDVLPWETRTLEVVLKTGAVSSFSPDYSRPSSNEEVSDFEEMEPEEFAEEYGLVSRVIEDSYSQPAADRPGKIKMMESIVSPQTYLLFFSLFVFILIALLVYIRTQVR